MAIPVASPALPKAALYLGIVSAVLVGVGLVGGLLGGIVILASRSSAVLVGGLVGIALISAPAFALAAIVTGHVSCTRFPGDGRGRAGFVIGYCVLGSMIGIIIIAVLIWQTIPTIK
jgi:hypothetical protein